MKKKRRESELAAAIDIGSRAVGMDIVEFAAGERPVLLETLRREVDLGREVFRSGEVPPGETALVCDIMADCRRKLDEYRMTDVRAAASGALRAAANCELVVDLLFQAGGIRPEIPESPEECRRFAAAVRKSLAAAGADAPRVIALRVDAWSLLLLAFEDGVLRFGEELPVGSDRLPEETAPDELATAIADKLVASGALRRLKGSLTDAAAPTLLVAAGDGARRIAGVDDDPDALRHFAPEEFVAAAGKKRAAGDGAAETAGAVGALLENFRCTGVAVPGFTARSVLLDSADEAESRSFAADLAGVAAALAGRFAVDAPFAQRTKRAAAELWKKLRTRHAMPERTLPLLEAAAVLRDVGGCLDGCDDGTRSEYIIDSLSLPGASCAERRLVAAAAHFAKAAGDTLPANVGTVAKELRPELFRMAAILRTAGALAEDPADRFSGMRLNIAGDELIVTPRSAATGAERAALAAAAGLFVRVFGLKPRLGEAMP